MENEYYFEGNRLILTQNLAPTLYEKHIEEFFERRDYDLLSESFAKYNKSIREGIADNNLKRFAVPFACCVIAVLLIAILV